MGIGGRVVMAAAYTNVRLRLRFESSVMMLILTAGKKLMARIAPLFIQFRRNGIIDIYRTAMIPDVVFALLLTVIPQLCERLYGRLRSTGCRGGGSYDTAGGAGADLPT